VTNGTSAVAVTNIPIETLNDQKDNNITLTALNNEIHGVEQVPRQQPWQLFSVSSTESFGYYIYWGDQVLDESSFNFKLWNPGDGNIADSHTYAKGGTYTIDIWVFPYSRFGAQWKYTYRTATIDESAVNDITLSSTGMFPGGSVTENTNYDQSLPVLSFQDSQTTASANEFNQVLPVIWWTQDGQTTYHISGQVTGSGGAFNVKPAPNYSISFSKSGSALLWADIYDIPPGGNGATVKAHTFFDTVVVNPVQVNANWYAQPINQTMSRTVPPQVLATYTVPTTTDHSYSAKIDWGDGTTAADGSIQQVGGVYQISGGHTYAYDGSYMIRVTIRQDGVNPARVNGPATIAVGPGGPLTVTVMQLTATEGTPLGDSPVTVAMVRGGTPSQATIDWGDGSSSPGMIQPYGSSYKILGNHTYAFEGTYAVKVTATPPAGASSTAVGTATVADSIQINSNSLVVTRRGVLSTDVYLNQVPLATFSDPGVPFTNYPLAYYQAWIDWGDGSQQSGVIAPGLNGMYYVYGSHDYSSIYANLMEGGFQVQVTIQAFDRNLTDPNSTQRTFLNAIQTTSTVRVARAGVATLSDPEVAIFNDTVSGGATPSSIYDVAINWGDGAPPSEPENYQYTDYAYVNYPDPPAFARGFKNFHVFRQAGTLDGTTATYFDAKTHQATGRMPASGGFVVAPAPTVINATLQSPLQNAAYPGVIGVMNQPLAGIGPDGQPDGAVALATFYNADPTMGPASFRATIYWGDGTQSLGAVAGNPGGSFTVYGNHVYQKPGVWPITILVQGAKPPYPTLALTLTYATVAPDTQVHQRLPGTRLEVGSDASADGGQVTLAPNTGAVQVYQPLDPRLSHNSSLDGFIDLEGNPLQGLITGDDRLLNPPDGASPGIRSFGALVYSSDTVQPRPIAEVDAYFDPSLGVPTNLTATLTIGGLKVSNTFGTGSHQPGDTYALALEAPASATPQTGVYSWTVDVTAAFSNGTIPPTQHFTGNALVVANDASQFGAGWTLDGVNQLLVTPAGVLMTYGSGAAPRFFANRCDYLGFISPPDDFGTLSWTGLYTLAYRSKYGVTWTYDTTNADPMGHTIGVLTSITEPHGLTVTLMYDTSSPGLPRLLSLQWPDSSTPTMFVNNPATNHTTAIQEPGTGRQLALTYDALNTVLTGITDVDSSLRKFMYDGSNMHRLTNVQWTPLNLTMTYDTASGDVTAVDQGQNTKWTLQPANLMALQSAPALNANAVAGVVTDPLNNRSTYTLDFLGWATELDTPTPVSATSLWARDPSEQVAYYMDALDHATVYSYGNGAGDLLQVEYADGGIAQYTYDPVLHRRTSYQDPDNNLTQYGNNPFGDLVTITNALNQVTTQNWDTSRALMLGVIDARGNPTSYAYFAAPARLLQTKTDAQPATYTYDYDANGYPKMIKDPLGRITSPVYDARGRLRQTTDATTTGIVSQVYDALGLVTAQQDQLGRVTSTGYDGHGWPTTVTEAVGTPVQRTTTTLYDAAGNVTAVIRPQTYDGASSPINIVTSYAYDVLNRPYLKTEDAGDPTHKNYQTLTLYDAVGNVLGTKDPAGLITDYDYDALNRQTAVTEGYGSAVQRSTTTLYDPAGNVTSVIDPRGADTRYAYDALNRPTTLIQAYGVAGQQRTTATAYDHVGNVLSVTKPHSYDTDPTSVNVTTSYAYDAVNRQTLMIEAYQVSGLQRTTTTLYDAVGNVQSVTRPQTYDSVMPPVRITTSYAYDVVNRRTAVVADFGNFQQTTTTLYDAVGNVTQTTDPRGTATQFLYDALNRLTLTVVDAGPGKLNQTTAKLYDAADNVTQTTDPRHTNTQTAYDALNRPTTLVEGINGLAPTRTTTMLYDPDGNELSVTKPQTYDNAPTPVQITTSYGYDALNRQTTLIQDYSPLQGPGHFNYITTTAYDASDHVTQTIDPRGTATNYAYDLLGRRTAEIDAVGMAGLQRTTSMLYDAADNLLTVSRPQGYDLDAMGNPVPLPAQTVTSSGYDVYNRPTTVIEAYGVVGQQRTTTTLYDAANNVVSVTKPQSYDSDTNPVRVTTSYAYDTLNRQTTMIEGIYNTSPTRTTTMLYDAAGNVTSVTQPQTYDGASNPVRVTTSYAYDALNRTTLVIADSGPNKLNQTTATLYDLNGNVTQTIDPRGTATNTAYDYFNRPTLVVEGIHGAAPTRTTTMLYDAANNEIAVTKEQTYDGASNPVRITTSFSYDALNRQTTIVEAANWPALKRTTGVAYDADGNRLSVTTPQGYDADTNQVRLTTSYGYDRLNRPTTLMTGYGLGSQAETTATVYDAANNVLQTTDPGGTVTSYNYDALNRRTQTVQTDPATNKLLITTQAYDAADHLRSRQVPAVSGTRFTTEITTFSYDALGRTMQTQDPRKGLITQSYDAANNLIQVRDAKSNLTMFLYDDLNRQVAMQNAFSSNPATYAYDLAGNLTSTTDQLGRRQDSTYDTFNRLVTQTWYKADGTTVADRLTYTYDAADDLLTAANTNPLTLQPATYTMMYDALGRATVTQDLFGLRLTATYDAANHRTEVDDPFTGVTTSLYDALGRLTSQQVTSSQPAATFRTDLGYNQRDQVTTLNYYSDLKATNLVASTTYLYDALGRIAQLNVTSGAPHPIETLGYGYDAAGRLNNSTRKAWQTAYDGGNYGQINPNFSTGPNTAHPNSRLDYDAAGSLRNDGTATYGYDGAGNRTKSGGTTASYGAGNKLLEDAKWSYDSYDAVGNLLHKVSKSSLSKGWAWTYTYDVANRLVGAAYYDNQGQLQQQVTYVYDVFGRRVETDVYNANNGATTTTRYAQDGSNVWATLDGNNQLQMRYVHGPATDQLFARLSTVANAAVPLWFVQDRQNSVIDILTISGAAAERVFYSGYGLVVNQLIFMPEGTLDPYQYTGREQDATTNLQYNRARWYDPWSGRFVTPDPLGFQAGDTNLYRYGDDSPTNATDPQGAAPEWLNNTLGFLKGVGETGVGVVVGAYHLSPVGQVVDAISNNDARYLIPGYHMYNQYQQTRDAYVQAGFTAEDAKTLAIFRSVPVLNWAVFAEEVRTGRSLSPDRFDQALTAEDYGRGVSQIAFDVALLRGVGRSLGGGGAGAGAGPRGAWPQGWVGQAWSWTKTAASWTETALTPSPVWLLRGAGWAAGRALRWVAPKWTAQFEAQVHAQHANGWSGAVQYQLAQWLRLNICLGAGTPLRTPTGAKRIEEIREGDLLLARDQSDPTAPVEAKRVEAVFVRTGRLLHVHVGGQVIRTTAEHPFWVEGHGWTPTRELRAGDRLSSHDGQWVAVEEVFDTGEYEVVYNLRAADYHTYFVGTIAWGFSVWAHNAECVNPTGLRETAGVADNVAKVAVRKLRGPNGEQAAVDYLVSKGVDPAVAQEAVGVGMTEPTSQLPVSITPEAPEGAIKGTLVYRHQARGGNAVPDVIIQDQISGQINGFNRIIQQEGLAGLKARIQDYLAYPQAIDAAGRNYTRRLSRLHGDPPDGQVWIHEPDMATGGLPTDVFRFGDARADFVLGGQAHRIAADILKLPENVNWLQATYIPPKPR
jgi:RHS repeat-associated protein